VEKFDPKEEYIRRWVPELATSDYPAPVVDHAAARDRALDAFDSLKQQGKER
jgi:deoxyribodipyrimidine photo-lyase